MSIADTKLNVAQLPRVFVIRNGRHGQGFRRPGRQRADADRRLQQTKSNAARDRTRLIDHFKRLYTIIAGLAITEACKKLMPIDLDKLSPAAIWMFLAFLVTIMPIFQGGDRSLDIKYLDEKENDVPHNKLAFVWDVFMLIITALFFLVIAEAIPAADKPRPEPRLIMFFFAMSGLFFFDSLVLFIDYLKSHVRIKLEVYAPWILMNSFMCAICFFAADGYRTNPDYSLSTVSAAIFVCAAGRSFFDYVAGRSFMFP